MQSGCTKPYLLPQEQFRHEVEKHLTGNETEMICRTSSRERFCAGNWATPKTI